MKALEKLRERIKMTAGNLMWKEDVAESADEIEREHAQRVAELNGAICERDGRISSYERRNTELNDALKTICKRFGVSTEWSAEGTAKKVLETLERDRFAYAGNHRHRKPTVEDVLREVVAAYMDTSLDDSNEGEFFEKYADKLREAMKGATDD